MKKEAKPESDKTMKTDKPSSLVDTRVIYCGDNLEQLKKLPDGCVDLIYIDPPFNSNRNYEVFWGETKEKRSFEDRHALTQTYIDFIPSLHITINGLPKFCRVLVFLLSQAMIKI
jgi:DNA modification methylase